VVGVVLVALSVSLGGWVFARADNTVAVYVVADSTAVGTRLDQANLEVINVHLDTATTTYLSVEEADELKQNPETIFTSPVGQGQLIPTEAIGNAAELSLRPLSLEVAHTATLKVGQLVDLWVTADDLRGAEDKEPELVARGLHVVSIEEEDPLFGSSGVREVQILVPEAAVSEVLKAVSGQTKATLVPQVGGAGG